MPQIATLICILFILYLFWVDRKKSDGHSNALWIPFIWMFLAGSRYVSSWLQLSAPIHMATSYDEGSPVDRAVFSLLIAAGILILWGRKIDWLSLLKRNKLIWLYLLYCGASIIWTDDSFLLLKRWIKELGNLIMILVILTERRPYEAVGTILRRLAFLWLPLSFLFVKFYPALGRAYHVGGGAMYTGVGHQKNDLGQICLISGIYFAWNFFMNRKEHFKLIEKNNINYLILTGMIAWLLHMAQSATSVACLLVAVSLIFISHMRVISQKPNRIMVLAMVLGSLFLVLEATLDLSGSIITLLGRDSTLTSRVPIWHKLQEMVTNPFIGTGYMSFWSGDRLKIVWEKLDAGIIQAHNGYLEQYLNLGYIGVAFIAVIMLSGLLKVQRHLNMDYPSAILKLCFIVTAALYNYTEASFYGLNCIWLLLLIGVIEISAQQEAKT